MRLSKLFHDFFESEKAGGILLLLATVLSLTVANTSLGSGYIGLWNIEIADHSLVHWINDGLMTFFFLLIGLELEREIYKGELSNIRIASLPIIAAIGGMLVPAGIYLLLNYGTPTQDGAGISMATDIAFAVGILALLGSRVPNSLKIFLTALAVIDDLGAIIVIAVFYSSDLILLNLIIALSIFGGMLLLNRLRVHVLWPYLFGGVVMWYFMLHSGVHATITGVLLAFAIPFGSGDEYSPSYRLQHFLHKPVAFFILPLFAIANTCIAISPDWLQGLSELNSLGIMAGLIVGKPIGIFLFALLAVAIGLCTLPADLKWRNILGAGFLGGIGFTMSIFITLLAFDQSQVIDNSKIAIIVASVIAGGVGYIILKRTLPKLK